MPTIRIKNLRQFCRKVRSGALGHGENQSAGSGGDALIDDKLLASKGCSKVNAAEQLLVGNRRMQFAQRQGQSRHQSQKGLTRRAGPCAQAKTFQACGINRQKAQRLTGSIPSVAPLAHPSTSATVRATRAPDPASSSGSRRSRWLRAEGAMLRK